METVLQDVQISTPLEGEQEKQQQPSLPNSPSPNMSSPHTATVEMSDADGAMRADLDSGVACGATAGAREPALTTLSANTTTMTDTSTTKPASGEEEEIDIDLSDPDVGKAALKLQAGFRGLKTRKGLAAKTSQVFAFCVISSRNLACRVVYDVT